MPMEKPSKYKILLSKDALADIKETKEYILTTFKYREYAENFPIIKGEHRFAMFSFICMVYSPL